MIPGSLSPIANHLWQSTLFVGVAGLLILVLQKNSARVRHWVWMAASLKFLVPFALLVALGSHFDWRPAPGPTPTHFTIVMGHLSQPFMVASVVSPSLPTTPQGTNSLPLILGTAWALGFVGIAGSWWIRWRRIRAAVRAGSPLRLDLPIRAICSPSFLEPGVFGVFRPVLVLPEGILEYLTPEQRKSVLAHELCHVRHRDNLVGMVQMLVETIFWFHPLVWWVGKRIFQERETACDEEVLRLGSEPRTYAQSILKVCQLYLESPVACVAGVSGANLRKRIEGIMNNRIGHKLTGGKRLLLAGTGILAVAAPIVLGMVDAPRILAQSQAAFRPSFEVASIKLDTGGSLNRGTRGLPDGSLQVTNMSVMDLITYAYSVRESEVSGGPGWLQSSLYDIAAKAPTGATPRQIPQMIQSLLAERFQLRLHRENWDMPIYSLRLAKGGPRFEPAKEGSCGAGPAPSPKEISRSCGYNMLSRATFDMLMLPMQKLADTLSGLTGRRVVDETGLTGLYSLHLDFAPELADDPSHPSIFTSVQEQLGLRLESSRGPVEVLVIDSAERPSEN